MILPNVGAVECDEDWNIADDLNPALFCVSSDFVPLAEEKVLEELLSVDVPIERFAEFAFTGLLEGEAIFGPLIPRSAVEVILQGLEESVCFEPVIVVFFEVM